MMPNPAAATVMVAQGSTAITWEVATILAEGLSRLGLSAGLGEREAVNAGVPIVIFGQGATVAPPMTEADARRAVVLLVAGPETQAFDAAAGLGAFATACFAVSPRTVARLNAQGVPTERFVLGHSERWDTGGAANRDRSIDILHIGELDTPGRRTLARVAPELGDLQSHIQVTCGRPDDSAAPEFASSPLIADAKLTLSLNRWGDARLDWPTVVRAMCNGSVVIAERAAGYGELVPGEHFLLSRSERIGPVIRAALADPEAVTEMATAAYQLCRNELAMDDSLERLAAVAARRPRVRMRIGRTRARATVAPSRTGTASERLDFATVGLLDRAPDAGTSVDVICMEHPGSGPIALTRDGLTRHPLDVNLHVGKVERHLGPLPASGSDPTEAAIAEVRNDLVRHSSAPLVMFVDSGDEILTDTLARLVAALGSSSQVDIGMPLVALGTDDLAYPDLSDSDHGAEGGDGLPRGYVVRRSYLERTGPFVGGGGGAPGLDREFWRRAASVGGRVAVLPRVGVRLWQHAHAG